MFRSRRSACSSWSGVVTFGDGQGACRPNGSGSCPPGRWATSRRINVRSTTGSSRGHAEPGQARRDAVPGRGAGGAVAAGDPGRRGIRLAPGVSGSVKRNSLPCLGGCPPCGGGFHGAKTPLARRGRRLPAAHADEVLDYADLGRGGLRDVEPQGVQHIWHDEVRPRSVRTGRSSGRSQWVTSTAGTRHRRRPRTAAARPASAPPAAHGLLSSTGSDEGRFHVPGLLVRAIMFGSSSEADEPPVQSSW